MDDPYYSSPSSSSTPPTSGPDGGERRRHRIFNPYSTLESQQILPIHQLIYDLPTSPEFLFDEEAATRHRSWSHNLSFCTGVGYLSGAVLGAAKGSSDGLRAAEAGESLKLRTNRVLNSGGQAGRSFGNTVGVMGLMFSVIESGIVHITGDEGYLSTVAAGLGTGMVYKAAKGPRSAAIAGAIGGIAAGVAVAGKQVVKRYVPI